MIVLQRSVSPRIRLSQAGREALLPLLACLPVGIIYLLTMAPTVYGLDSAELTTGAYTLGVIHAPGSPLFLLTGWLFTHLPVGDVGYRVNLVSVVSGALTSALLFCFLHRLTQKPLLALLCAWWLAFSYYGWASSLAAELYSPAACFLAAVLLLALHVWEEQRTWQFAALGMVFGLGLGVHLMLALSGAGLAWLVIRAFARTRQVSFRKLALLAAGFMAGFAVYLYLPIRYLSDARLNYARDYWQVNLATWDGFWWMVTGRMFAGFMLSVPPGEIPAEAGRFVGLVISSFTLLGAAAGVWGIVALFRRRRDWGIALVLMLAGHLAFYLPYNVVDKDLMFLPAYLVWVVFIAAGMDDLLDRLVSRLDGAAGSLAYAVLSAVLVFQLLQNAPLINLSQDRSARRIGEQVFAALPQEAWFFGTWSEIPVLEYLQIVEGQRPDLVLKNLYFTGPEAAQDMAFQRLQMHQPVFTSMPEWFQHASLGTLQISKEPVWYQVVLK